MLKNLLFEINLLKVVNDPYYTSLLCGQTLTNHNVFRLQVIHMAMMAVRNFSAFVSNLVRSFERHQQCSFFLLGTDCNSGVCERLHQECAGTKVPSNAMLWQSLL